LTGYQDLGKKIKALGIATKVIPW